VTQKLPKDFPPPTSVSYRADLAAMDPMWRMGADDLACEQISGYASQKFGECS
jgi:hypothetical protein